MVSFGGIVALPRSSATARSARHASGPWRRYGRPRIPQGLLAGLFTRLAAFAICIDLGVAIWKVHWHHGLMGEGGFEFPLAVATIAFALMFFGGGPIALDHILRGGGTWSKK
jgi:hypothetical protein